MASITTTIDELMDSVRKLVDACSPELIRQKIINTELRGWDGWDYISEGFLRALVIDSVLESLGIEQSRLQSIIGYGFKFSANSSFVFFEDDQGAEVAFLRFASEDPYGVVTHVDGTNVASGEGIRVRLSKAYFKCRLNFDDGSSRIADSITFLL